MKNKKNIQTNNKKTQENQEKTKKKGFLWLLGMSFISVGLLLFCQFYFGNTIDDKTVFYDNTRINGIDVSGLNRKEAENLVSTKMLSSINQTKIKLDYQDKSWEFSGNDFEVNADISDKIYDAISFGREGNIIEKTKQANKIKQEGFDYNIAYSQLFSGLDKKLDEINQEIYMPPTNSKIVFNPDEEVMFKVQEAQNGVELDKEKLYSLLDESFSKEKIIQISLPIKPILPEEEKENISMRSSFSTDYSTSSKARKSNVKLALSKFNGMIVEPNQEISFNQITGSRNQENGYQKANIIQNGVFVEGSGGGVCQASTTLYNALVLSDVEIEEVHHHSLPVSYVPLSSDAMVSEGFADLVFKNTTDTPLYIKTICNDTLAKVEIYGASLGQGQTRKVRSELVKIIPHNGDKIIQDTNGEYASQILYKGEYVRVKYPKEGYETKAYLQYLENGEVVKEKEIRHDFYWPQDGVVVEGKYDIGNGMTLPESDVKLIPAQNVTETHFENIKNKFKKTYPNAFEA